MSSDEARNIIARAIIAAAVKADEWSQADWPGLSDYDWYIIEHQVRNFAAAPVGVKDAYDLLGRTP